MLATIFLLATLFENMSAFTGFTTAGMRFSIAFPKIGLDNPHTVGKICMFTEEPMAESIVNYPRDSLSSTTTKWSKSHYKLVKYQRAEHPIDSFYLMKTSGIYNTIYIEANAPIRVTVQRSSNDHDYSDMHVALPEVSCHTSYYVTTGPDRPFVVVLSFRFEVKITLHFPKSTGRFDLFCSAKSNCAHNSKTSLTLGENKAWYLHISSSGVDLQNTRIQANRPIYVFAGNADYHHKDSRDTIISSISPTATWGKEYVVPRGISLNDIQQTVLLRFNTKQLPFEFKQCDGSTVKVITLTNLSSVIEYSEFVRPYVINADTPFGLYQLLLSENNPDLCDVGFTNLIPTEQWINGVVYHNVNDSNTLVHILIYSTAAPKNVVVGGKNNSFSWEVLPADKYFYGSVNIVTNTTTIYTKESNGRVMLYIVSQPKHKQSCSYWPLDFYAGKIYDNDCKVGVPVTSDGVDNDCDGFIDEESSNGQDDDNDGEVDEDNVEAIEDSKWTAWTHACKIRCGHLKYVHGVRACKTNRFGKACEGETEICVPGLTCNITCSKEKISTICDCQKGCANCTRSINTSRCAICKDGYFQDPYCLRPCPPGWAGKGCWARIELTKAKDVSKHSSHKINNTAEPFNPMNYLLIAVASAVLFVCLICVGLKFDKSTDEDEEEKFEDEEDEEDEEEEEEDEYDEEDADWEEDDEEEDEKAAYWEETEEGEERDEEEEEDYEDYYLEDKTISGERKESKERKESGKSKGMKGSTGSDGMKESRKSKERKESRKSKGINGSTGSDGMKESRKSQKEHVGIKGSTGSDGMKESRKSKKEHVGIKGSTGSDGMKESRTSKKGNTGSDGMKESRTSKKGNTGSDGMKESRESKGSDTGSGNSTRV